MIKAVNGLFYAVYEKEHREKTMVNIKNIAHGSINDAAYLTFCSATFRRF